MMMKALWVRALLKRSWNHGTSLGTCGDVQGKGAHVPRCCSLGCQSARVFQAWDGARALLTHAVAVLSAWILACDAEPAQERLFARAVLAASRA